MTEDPATVPDLGKFVSIYDFNPRWAPMLRWEYSRSTPIYLPTEMVIRSAGIFVPEVAHVYKTPWYVVPGSARPHTYSDLVELDGFKGTDPYPEVVMATVWEDQGQDGHTDYVLQGYRFVSSNQIGRLFSALPPCMLLTEMDEST